MFCAVVTFEDAVDKVELRVGSAVIVFVGGEVTSPAKVASPGMKSVISGAD